MSRELGIYNFVCSVDSETFLVMCVLRGVMFLCRMHSALGRCEELIIGLILLYYFNRDQASERLACAAPE